MRTPSPRSISRRNSPAARWRRSASAASNGQPGHSGLVAWPGGSGSGSAGTAFCSGGAGIASGSTIHLGVELEQLAAPLGKGPHPLRAGDLGPRAVIRGVQVDPGDQPVPRLGVEPHAVVALGEHLHKLGRVGVELHRHEHVVIALQARPADEPVQLGVGDGEMTGVDSAGVEQARVVVNLPDAAQVGNLQPIRRGWPLWQPTQYLSSTGCTSRAKLNPRAGPVPRRDLRRPATGGERPPVRRAGVLALVAADARDDFARHGREPTPHQLQRLALGVQRLHGDRRVGRHAEQGRAVLLDRHGAEDALDVPGAFHADDALRPAHVRVEIVVARAAAVS